MLYGSDYQTVVCERSHESRTKNYLINIFNFVKKL